jgi:hypothetical protein
MDYFDIKRELSKIYGLGIKAIKRKDAKYINFLLSELDKMKEMLDLEDMDNFGKYVANKSIKNISQWLNRSLP